MKHVPVNDFIPARKNNQVDKIHKWSPKIWPWNKFTYSMRDSKVNVVRRIRREHCKRRFICASLHFLCPCLKLALHELGCKLATDSGKLFLASPLWFTPSAIELYLRPLLWRLPENGESRARPKIACEWICFGKDCDNKVIYKILRLAIGRLFCVQFLFGN